MPELPEVETIKSELSPHIVGRQFTGVTVYDAKPVRRPSVEEFCRELVGQKVERLERRGKYLVFHLSSGQTLIVHLKMTGVLLLNPGQVEAYVRVVFHLDNGSRLVFSDRRRLGALWLVDNEKVIISKLGPEPLAAEFTAEALAGRLQKHQAPIKAMLLDQAFLAGLGNMYADEVLFVTRIHPLRRANSLSSQEVQQLHQTIRDVLQSAIGNKGASIDTYTRPGGGLGTAHFNFRVAHRGGEPCPVCGTPIQRLAVRNRGSYFCPACQKLLVPRP